MFAVNSYFVFDHLAAGLGVGVCIMVGDGEKRRIGGEEERETRGTIKEKRRDEEKRRERQVRAGKRRREEEKRTRRYKIIQGVLPK